MTNPITRTDIEALIKKKNLPKNKSPWPDSFAGEFYQIPRNELKPVFLKIFQNIAEERTFPNSFYEATNMLIPKPGKDNRKSKITGQYHL